MKRLTDDNRLKIEILQDKLRKLGSEIVRIKEDAIKLEQEIDLIKETESEPSKS